MKFDEKEAVSIGRPPYALVYFLLLDGEVVYVGQTVMGTGRIGAHTEDKYFDDVYAIRCNPTELDELEDYYIWKYMPKYNRKPNSVKSISMNRVKQLIKDALTHRIEPREIRRVISELNIVPRVFRGVTYITQHELDILIHYFIALEEDSHV